MQTETLQREPGNEEADRLLPAMADVMHTVEDLIEQLVVGGHEALPAIAAGLADLTDRLDRIRLAPRARREEFTWVASPGESVQDMTDRVFALLKHERTRLAEVRSGMHAAQLSPADVRECLAWSSRAMQDARRTAERAVRFAAA